MINNIDNNSIIICPNNIKKDILLNNNTLKNIKFLTINEFINNYYGTYKNAAIYYVMKKYNYNYDVTKEYLNNIFYDYESLKDLYYDLECNNLLDINILFKEQIKGKKIYVINYYNLDKYIIELFKKLDVIFINDNNNYVHDVYEFKTIDDEVVYVLNDIIKNHKEHLNDVYLINLDKNYYNVLKRLSNMFNINVNLKENNSIYSVKDVQDFINYLKNNNVINLDLINNIDIKNKIINIINKYNCDEIDKYYIEILENEIKNTYLDENSYNNAINIMEISDIYLKDKYYYILNFNQGSIPKVFHDDKLIKDSYRLSLGLNTSLDNLNNYKNMVINKLSNYKNIIITYKLKDAYKDYIKSPLIDELNLKIIKYDKKEYNYSNKYNKIELTKMLDDYNKYNILNNDINDLYKTYGDINYMTYDNTFKNIDYSLLNNYVKNNINISYSSMDNYFKCKFRYYINNILNLGDYKDTLETLIGKLFHYVLSKMYEEDFDLKKEYDSYLNDKVLTSKEKFYINKLYTELETIIKVIKSQDRHSKFSDTLTEHNVLIKKDEFNIKGFIDKVRVLKENNNTYVSIIDYKTGSTDLSLDNINYGLNLQLPMYLYLIKKDMDNVKVVGFYLQHILENKKINSKDNKKDVFDSLKLLGYTINKESLIEKIDDTYNDSEVIRGMKTSSNGFYKNAKLVSDDEIDKIMSIVDNHIKDVITSIKNGDFAINPKRINNELLGCKYCKFKDLCFKKEEDIKDLKNKTREEILGS